MSSDPVKILNLAQELQEAFSEWHSLRKRLIRIGRLAADASQTKLEKQDVANYEKEVYEICQQLEAALIRNTTGFKLKHSLDNGESMAERIRSALFVIHAAAEFTLLPSGLQVYDGDQRITIFNSIRSAVLENPELTLTALKGLEPIDWSNHHEALQSMERVWDVIFSMGGVCIS